MNISRILLHIRPGAQWTLRGETFADLEWHDRSQLLPTLEEMEVGQAQLDNLAYQDVRKSQYPSIGDQLDALWKGGAEAQAMLTQIHAVKAKYPKPI